jgi:pentatricopeptide repeat protein
MCAKCGRTEDAYKLFVNWSHKEDFNIAFTSILSSYIRDGCPEKTLNHYIFCTEFEPSFSLFMDGFVMATNVRACGVLGFGGMGQQMHCLTVKCGMCCVDPTVGNAIVSMYARCGNLELARKVFDEMHSH